MNDEPLTESDEAPLSAVEVRILGCLIEKQATTPEAYPLTLNALVLACNQKTSREPLMNLNPGQVGQGLRSLEGRGLTRLVMGSRADRWEQRADKTLELVEAQVVLIGLLLLRGPQTLNELLTRSSRMHAFEDLEQVRHHLDRLITRGLVIQLARQTGQREERYMHLMGEPEDLQALLEARASEVERPVAGSQYEARLEALEARIAELEERLARLE
ncbi:YceH family protein [Pseudomonas sp. MBLB4136]|uniref:YceH family protein n=1 Tax=Pseudomonas sp. MBLB4136 TaxID=3451558 RepID=UPI003F74DF1A